MLHNRFITYKHDYLPTIACAFAITVIIQIVKNLQLCAQIFISFCRNKIVKVLQIMETIFGNNSNFFLP